MSSERSSDSIVIEFINEDAHKLLQNSSHIVNATVPRQMEDTTINKAISESMNGQLSINWILLVGGILMSLFVQSNKSGLFMLLMIRNLQMIQYAPLFAFAIQANMIDTLNILRPLLQFDIIGDIIEFHWLFQFN